MRKLKWLHVIPLGIALSIVLCSAVLQPNLGQLINRTVQFEKHIVGSEFHAEVLKAEEKSYGEPPVTLKTASVNMLSHGLSN